MTSAKKLGIFVVVALVAHLLLVALNGRLFGESRLGQVEAVVERLGDSGGVFILGNSHAAAVDESLIDGADNLASYGESLHQTYYRLKDLIEVEGKTPEVVILSYDLLLLRNPLEVKDPNQFYWNGLENWGELSRFAPEKLPFFTHRLSSAVVPYKNLDVVLFDFLFAGPPQPAGALRDSENAELPVEQATDLVRRPTPEGLGEELSDYGIFYFTSLVELCRERKIFLCLVRFPVTKGYYLENSLQFDPKDYYERLEKIVADNGRQVAILDLHDAFPEEDFRDPHHLKGGEPRKKMTRLIRDFLEQEHSHPSEDTL